MPAMDSLEQLATVVAERWVVISTAILVLAVSLWAPSLANQFRTWQIPMIGEELGTVEKRRQAYLGGARKLYNEGYRKVWDPGGPQPMLPI